LLDDANLGKSYRAYARIVTESSVMARHFPFVAYFQYLPSWLVTRLSSRFGILKAHLDVSATQRLSDLLLIMAAASDASSCFGL
jgi:hypothetical protein